MPPRRGDPIRILLQAFLAVFLSGYLAAVYAETYYIDAETGDDRNSGITSTKAWKTLYRVNSANFSPGDKILFKRNQHWRGTLVVPSSGATGQPITFSAYGEGANPLVMRTHAFSDWELLTDRSDGPAKIWTGKLPGVKNSWGLVQRGARAPVHAQHSDIAVEDMEDGHFYSPLNQGRFYFRSDTGNPGTVEIGAVPEAIRVKDKEHIVIEHIDVFGPGGRDTSGGSTGFKTISITGKSHDVVLQHLSITHGNSIGVSSDSTTSNITYRNLSAHDNAGTGIYMNARGGSITRCRSHDNGRLDSDKGDRGGIGSFKGSDILIESNEVFNNGPDNGSADFEISIVATGPVSLLRNYVHDCLQGCIQIAEGGDDSIIAYNIISRYGSVKNRIPSTGNLSGIRIGGGKSGARQVKVYNNVVHGGRQPADARDAALYVAWFDNSGLQVRNNIFADNLNRHVYVRGNAEIGNGYFSHNLFSDISGKLNWKEKQVRDLKQWRTFTGAGNRSAVGDPLFENASGAFREGADFALRETSPAIDNGVFVGITRDYEGTVVPFGSAPDIGAIEAHASD